MVASTQQGGVLGGVYVPVVTPFDERDRVDLDALERLAEDVLAAGAAGLVVLATTGEPTSLDDGERDAVVAVCSRVCSDRGAALIVGAGTNDTRSTVARHVALGGVAGVTASLAVVPYYVRPTEAAIVAHSSSSPRVPRCRSSSTTSRTARGGVSARRRCSSSPPRRTSPGSNRPSTVSTPTR